MKPLRRIALLGALALALLGAGAGSASAAPILAIDLHHNQTNFPPGGTAQYWVVISNYGDTGTSGTVTVNVGLPSGITRSQLLLHAVAPFGVTWSCPGSPGDATLTCTTTDEIERHDVDRNLVFEVAVAPGVCGVAATCTKTAVAKVSGGGAADATATEPTTIDPADADFGVVAPSFLPDFFESDGRTPVRSAGARPDLFTVPFDFHTVPTLGTPTVKIAAGNVHDIHVDLPAGFLGDPTAVGECNQADFTLNQCPASALVGRLDATVHHPQGGDFSAIVPGVYNLTHPFGVVTDLAMSVAGNPVHIFASLDPDRGYAISTKVPHVNETLPVTSQKLTVWGVPADPAHDSERCPGSFGTTIIATGADTSSECPADTPLEPFLTLPARCGVEHQVRLHHYDSWQNRGAYGPDIPYTQPGETSGCDQIPFDPTVSVAPTTDAADSPSGLDVRIELPQNDFCDLGPPVSCDVATSPLKDATVTLPEGLTVNPASANGLEACTPAQISLGTDDPVQCPNASKVASVQVDTPLLPDPVEGVVYLAAQHDNPFDSLLAGYIVLADPSRGILVKIPGRIDVDKDTGQITGTFEDNPQLPFSEFELHFKGGAHSTLITPATCGDYTSSAEFSPWSGNAPRALADSFTITGAPGGGACANSETELPNSPGFDAGVASPVSQNFSPFVLHLRREDGSQRFGALNVSLPPGLTGKLAGAELCSPGALAAAESKSGKAEQANPSCPLGSRVGAVHAAAGAGPSPYNASGVAYLAGPYKGAPVSIATIVPAVAGPFDLGNVVVRAPVFVDPKTAKLSTTTDPFPEMLEGIPLDVRSVSVVIDRPEFTLTGTSCDPASVDGLLTSTLGQSAPLSVRYQLSDCRRLGFKPRMTLRLRGGTKRGKHPALTIALTPRPGDANIASVSVALPRSEFLENAHIRTVCTRPDFAADACPAAAVYGEATVDTPLLDYDLSGHVYLRSSDNLLPDVVPDLRGPAYQPIRLETAGRTDSIRGGIRTTIDFVPDAPFAKAVVALQGGNKGLLVNSRNICDRVYRATVRYRAHNGRAYTERPKMRVRCGRGKKRKGKRGAHKRNRAAAHRGAVR